MDHGPSNILEMVLTLFGNSNTIVSYVRLKLFATINGILANYYKCRLPIPC